MKNIEQLINELKEYDGRQISIMEVCGSHTAAIAKSGIKELISDKIKLISGPGCPVCVTPSTYIDKLIELAFEGNTIVTFGDLLRVPGSKMSLREATAKGIDVEMVYSPMDTLKLAVDNPNKKYIFAAIGFETTAPVFTLLLDEIIENNIFNIKLLTAIKTMPKAIDYVMKNGAVIDGFLAPGHVCAITGSDIFLPLANQYNIPFVVSGFSDSELVLSIYKIVDMIKKDESGVANFYTSIVEKNENTIAKDKLNKYFKPHDAAWRGMGIISDSGLCLKEEYLCYDAGSFDLYEDVKKNKACKCGEILMGKISSKECPLFGKVCTPKNPQGACMVSFEGSCYQNYINGGQNE